MSKVLLLVVEDDAALANMYAKKLELAGYKVEVGHNGQEAYEKVKQDQPSLVLLDIMMPDVNGLEGLKKIKSDPATKNTPVIMLSNLSGSAEITQAMSLGATGYIVKSDLTPAEVVEKVKEALA